MEAPNLFLLYHLKERKARQGAGAGKALLMTAVEPGAGAWKSKVRCKDIHRQDAKEKTMLFWQGNEDADP